MRASGGEAVQITRQGGFVPAASPDGQWIYYSKQGAGIWRVRIDGGNETSVLDSWSASDGLFTFTVTDTGIYYAGAPDLASGKTPSRFYRFADGKTAELAYFEKPLRL